MWTTTERSFSHADETSAHPGGVVLRQCIEPLGLSITDAAAALGVTRTTFLSERVNEKRGISPEMAVRLSKVFGGDAESWLVQQAQYDLAQVRKDRIKLKAPGAGMTRVVVPGPQFIRLTEAEVAAALKDPNPGNHIALAVARLIEGYRENFRAHVERLGYIPESFLRVKPQTKPSPWA
jgi:antitoxin HigA-1